VSTGFDLEFAYLTYVTCRVLIDDTDVTGAVGGQGYSYYSVADEGAIVVVRPDGYVATITPLDGVAGVDAYFARFMKA